MSINLSKNQKVNVDFNSLTIGLGWKPSNSTKSIDLDSTAFLLNADRKLPSDQHLVFYNNPKDPNNAVIHSGDDRTGTKSDGGDDEQVKIDLSMLGSEIEEILFVVTINDAKLKSQTFGDVAESYIRILNNATNTEIARFNLDESFCFDTGIEFGKLIRRDGAWKFEASGVGCKEELEYFVNQYYNGEVVK